jgi:hypothetical protein
MGVRPTGNVSRTMTLLAMALIASFNTAIVNVTWEPMGTLVGATVVLLIVMTGLSWGEVVCAQAI